MLSSSEVFQEVGPNEVHACCVYIARLELVFGSFTFNHQSCIGAKDVDVLCCE